MNKLISSKRNHNIVLEIGAFENIKQNNKEIKSFHIRAECFLELVMVFVPLYSDQNQTHKLNGIRCDPL